MVTGASSGLGADFARELALRGARTVLVARRENAQLALDIVTLAHTTKLFARDMAERGWGRILQVASIAAFQATPTYAVYGAAKSFVLHFSEAVNFELRASGVSVPAISPGITATEFLAVSGQKPTLYQRLMMMKSPDVARIGINALLARRASVVPGIGNRLTAWSIRWIPRTIATRVAYLTMRER